MWRMISETVGTKNISGPTTKTRTRTEIHIETREAFVVRSFRPPCIAGCEACGIEVRVLTPEAAALVAETTPREIYRRIEGRSLHAVETRDGATLICCNVGMTMMVPRLEKHVSTAACRKHERGAVQ
jgi:hypothetical protein